MDFSDFLCRMTSQELWWFSAKDLLLSAWKTACPLMWFKLCSNKQELRHFMMRSPAEDSFKYTSKCFSGSCSFYKNNQFPAFPEEKCWRSLAAMWGEEETRMERRKGLSSLSFAWWAMGQAPSQCHSPTQALRLCPNAVFLYVVTVLFQWPEKYDIEADKHIKFLPVARLSVSMGLSVWSMLPMLIS